MTEHSDQLDISVLGTGALGSAVAARLVTAGHRVGVWNRTPGKVDALVAGGASRCRSAHDAWASALVLTCLTDHDATAELLRPLVEGAHPHKTVVVLTNGTPDEAEELDRLLSPSGVQYVAAGVQAGPADLGTPRASLVFSGSPAGFDQHRPTLELLGTVTWLGADIRAAAVWDLALFGLWYDAQLGLLRAYEQLAAVDVPVDDVAAAAAQQLGHVVDATAATAAEIRDASYPRGPATLREHLPVLRNLQGARSGSRLGDGGLTGAARLVAQLVDGGRGDLGLTAIVDGSLTPAGPPAGPPA